MRKRIYTVVGLALTAAAIVGGALTEGAELAGSNPKSFGCESSLELAGSAGTSSKVVRESAMTSTQGDTTTPEEIAGSAGTSAKITRESA